MTLDLNRLMEDDEYAYESANLAPISFLVGKPMVVGRDGELYEARILCDDAEWVKRGDQ